MLLAQVICIWYLNIYLFEKRFKCDRLKLELISLILASIITFTLIFMYEYTQYQKTTLSCTRENGEIAYIRVGEYGIENIKINGQFVKDEEIINYNKILLVEILNNIKQYENQEELIKENMNSVIYYEKENNSTCKTIR
jgi:hypothetical protein